MKAVKPGGAYRCRYCDSTVPVHQTINPGHCGARTCFEQSMAAGARKRREEHH